MLDAVAQLPQHGHGNVRGVLGDEVHAHALGADQAHHLLHLFKQRLGAVVKEQMRLVKEEHHARFVQIAHLGQQLVELAEHPQQQRGVHRGMEEQPVGGKYVDGAATLLVQLHPVGNVDGGLAEEAVAALILQHCHGALDGADAGDAHVAVLQRVVARVLAQVGQHRLKILQIKQEHALVVRDAEEHVHHARLYLIEPQHAAEQQRPHIAHGHADWMSLFTVHIPEHGGIRRVVERGERAGGNARGERIAVLAGADHAAQVALDIRQKHGHAHVGKALGKHLEAHRLAGAGRAGDQAVAVGHVRQQEGRLRVRAHPDLVFVQHIRSTPFRDALDGGA